jgi:hypothetical protein
VQPDPPLQQPRIVVAAHGRHSQPLQLPAAQTPGTEPAHNLSTSAEEPLGKKFVSGYKLKKKWLLIRLPSSDVNVHKTNSFLKLYFQFVSISKRNVLFYPYITMIEMKIKNNSFKNH